jgi:hypothetical protein
MRRQNILHKKTNPVVAANQTLAPESLISNTNMAGFLARPVFEAFPSIG